MIRIVKFHAGQTRMREQIRVTLKRPKRYNLRPIFFNYLKFLYIIFCHCKGSKVPNFYHNTCLL
jgi:hypothetical protein